VKIDFLVKDESNKEKDLNFMDSEIRISSPTSSMDSRVNIIRDHRPMRSECVKKFLFKLDQEVKRIYIFFMNKERELYVSINSHLHLRQSYEEFSIYNLAKELNELYSVSEVALNLTQYISQNMMAIKSILNKFDKHFEKVYGKISFAYAERKIAAKNSDLLYILQFKVTSILIYRLSMRYLHCLRILSAS
jgi:SPX domain protein involved in polyphosphate accumulation